MTKPIFFCDLDQTLIFSQRLVDRHTGNYNGLVVVENHNKKPYSFMTFEAVRVLQELSKKVMFVPCSTRSPMQFERVFVPGVVTRHTILDNGGKIFTNNKEDKDWTKTILSDIQSESSSPAEIYAELTKKFSHEAWFDKIRLTSNMFVSIITHETVPSHFIEYVENNISSWNYRYSVQSRSIYMIPLPVAKEKAAAEITSRYGAEETFAAGDSILDLGLLEYATHAIRPAHGELFEKNLAPHIRPTTKTGVLAGEQILEFVTLTVS